MICPDLMRAYLLHHLGSWAAYYDSILIDNEVVDEILTKFRMNPAYRLEGGEVREIHGWLKTICESELGTCFQHGMLLDKIASISAIGGLTAAQSKYTKRASMGNLC